MYFLGVDGGGTKTAVVLVNDAADVVDAFKLGGGNIVSLGSAKTIKLIENILSRLAGKHDIEDIISATFAFAGAGRRAEKQIIESALKNSRLSSFTIMTDAEIMHYSFFASNSGVLISSGTGSVCLIRTENFEYFQLGGHGCLLGDEGSGFYIGREAIKKSVSDAEINRQKTLLTKRILDFYKIKEPREIISEIYASDNPQKLIASCAEAVCRLAEENEPDAVEIVSNAADALAALAIKAIRHYFRSDAEFYNIAVGGGILRQNSIVEKLFRQKMQDYGLNLRYFPRQMSSAAGAVMYSMAKSGLQISDSAMGKLKKIDI